MCWKNFSSWDSRERRNCGLELRTDWTSGKTGHWPESRNGEEAPCAGRAVPQGERRGRPTLWRAAQGGVLIKCPLFSIANVNSISIITKYTVVFAAGTDFLPNGHKMVLSKECEDLQPTWNQCCFVPTKSEKLSSEHTAYCLVSDAPM